MIRYISISNISLEAFSSLLRNGAISSICALTIPMMIWRHIHKLILIFSRSLDSCCRISDNSLPFQHLWGDSSEQKMYPISSSSLFLLVLDFLDRRRLACFDTRFAIFLMTADQALTFF